VSIDSPDQLAGLKAAGRVVAEALRAMRHTVRAGITTAELDAIGGRVFASVGARSEPQLDYDFPGVNCISVNDAAVHGIPGRRRLREGDLVKLDVAAELRGFYADACFSGPVGRASRDTTQLAAAAHAALREGLSAARAGAPLNAIGTAVEDEVTAHGYAVCAELTGATGGRSRPPTARSRRTPSTRS
jgi:methionyl aminopeptidase